MQRISTLSYYRMISDKYGNESPANMNVGGVIELCNAIEELQEQVSILMAQLETTRRAAESDEACTCTPLDGGLGATTCPACKATARNNQIEF